MHNVSFGPIKAMDSADINIDSEYVITKKWTNAAKKKKIALSKGYW